VHLSSARLGVGWLDHPMVMVRLMDIIWDWCERSGAALGWDMYRFPNIWNEIQHSNRLNCLLNLVA
jgi:hypothetical protein